MTKQETYNEEAKRALSFGSKEFNNKKNDVYISLTDSRLSQVVEDLAPKVKTFLGLKSLGITLFDEQKNREGKGSAKIQKRTRKWRNTSIKYWGHIFDTNN